jgi:hypothetical protein
MLVWGPVIAARGSDADADHGNGSAGRRRGLSRSHNIEGTHPSFRPLPIASVHQKLQQYLRDADLSHDQNLQFVRDMVEYMFRTYKSRCERGGTWACSGNRLVVPNSIAASRTGSGGSAPDAASCEGDRTQVTLGQLLPLSCGHNKNFQDHEKNELVEHIRAFGLTSD